MTDHGKRYDSLFKAKVVLESFWNEKTIAELASDYGVHPNQITQWRKQASEDLPTLFFSIRRKGEGPRKREGFFASTLLSTFRSMSGAGNQDVRLRREWVSPYPSALSAASQSTRLW
jgi:hypothetical protein